MHHFVDERSNRARGYGHVPKHQAALDVYDRQPDAHLVSDDLHDFGTTAQNPNPICFFVPTEMASKLLQACFQ